MEETEGSGNTEAFLASLLQNKELMGKVSALLGSMSGKDSEETEETTHAVAMPPGKTDIGGLLSLLSPLLDSKRTLLGGLDVKSFFSLIKALRPFLNPARRELIDKILSLEKIGTLFRSVVKEGS